MKPSTRLPKAGAKALLMRGKPTLSAKTNSPSRLFRFIEVIAIAIALITLIAQLWVSFLQYFEWQEEAKARHEERSARAWQILTTHAPGNSGKVEALEFLAKNNVPLNDIDLSCQSHGGDWLLERSFCASGRVYLRNLDLSMRNIGHRVKLNGANFSGADLTGAVFDGAMMSNANFNGALLESVSLRDTFLLKASFDGIVTSRRAGSFDLPIPDGEGGYLQYSKRIRGVDFRGAILSGNSFRHADLFKAKFDGSIVGVDFARARLTLADFKGVKYKFRELGEIFGQSWVWTSTPDAELPLFSDPEVKPRDFLLFCHGWGTLAYEAFETDFPDKYECKKWTDWSESERERFLRHQKYAE